MEGEITKTLIESQYPLWKIILLFILIQLIIILCSELIKKFIEKQAISKIKEIETSFTNQTEALKSQLSLLTNIKSEIYSTERNAIIDANEKLYMWLSHLKQNPSFDNNDDIEKYLRKMDSYYDKEQASEAMLELFIDDDSIIKIFKKISEHILVTQTKKELVLYQIKKNNSDSKNKTEELSQEQKIKLDDVTNRIVKIHPIIQEFRRNCKKYIYSKSLAKPEA